MSREWKPGDVAMVNDVTQPEKAWKAATCIDARRPGQKEAVWVLHESGARVWGSVSDARPLVVLDPEDREQVERLADMVTQQVTSNDTNDLITGALQAALREFADPKLPKPEEPMGLGAVVKDEKGRRWIRVGDASVPRPWAACGNVGDLRAWVRYADIDAVKVLSEGVR